MALTEQQRKWIADVLGVDVQAFMWTPGGEGAPGAAPDASPGDARRAPSDKSPKPPATPKTAPAARITLTVDNQSDRTLRFIKADNDGGRFDPPPPQLIAPKQKASLAVLDTGAKGGTLIYQFEAKDGAAEEPDQLPWWTMSWKPAAAGQLPQTEAKLDPEAKGYALSEAAGKASIAYMLAGTGTVAPSVSQPSQAAGQRRVDVTFVNRSDRWLKYWGADKMTVTFGQRPPDVLKPGASATFAIFAGASGEIHFGLMYSIVATSDTTPDAGAPKWTPHFTIPANTTVMVANSDIVPGIDGLKSSENPSADAVSYVLSGKAGASAQPPQVPHVPFRPQDVEQRIPVTLTNDSDRVLRYWGQDKMVVTFEQRPPEWIRPGQSFTFAIKGKRGTEIGFGLMYSILANETDKPDGETPKWIPYFKIPPAQSMIAHAHISNPGVAGLKAGGWPDKDGALFVLSGTAVAPAQPPQVPQVPFRPQDVEQRIPVTFTNDSNMVLRYWGADKMVVTFEQKPPEWVKPGQSVTFTIKGRRGTEIRFGLMYAILANEAETATTGTPKWTPHFRIPPAGQMIAHCVIHPGMGGLKAGGWPDQDGALFGLSGKWAKDQELKTPASIKNATPYRMRLVDATSAKGRFDPAPPAEIGPGATATCASWARVESDQKLVYELDAADGTPNPRTSGSPKRWTITWHTKPGESPRVDSKVENVGRHGSARGLDGDGVRFELEIEDDTNTK